MILQQPDIFGNVKDITHKKNVKSSKKRDDILLSLKIKELDKVYSQIYDTLDINLFEQNEILIIGKIIAYPEERQAELMGTQLLSIDERLKLNKELIDG